MHLTARSRWVPPMLLVAVIYAVVGIVTADLARSAPSPQMRTVWRLTAWLLSLIGFAGHIAHEQLRLRSAVRATAAHTAAAVALGAFALAAAGPVRGHWGASDFWRASVLSLLLWPVLTGVPAFLVALVGGSMFRRFVVHDHSAPANRA
jgi:hypothetical protein